MASKSHVVLTGSRRAKDPEAVRVRDVDPKEKLDVTIGLAGPKLPGADEKIGETMTPAAFAKQFGAAEADADKVARPLEKFGLHVEDVSLETRSMRVSGTAAAMEAAFKPGLSIMHSALAGDYLGRTGTLQIPAELKGIVRGVFGLDQRRMARRKALAAAATGLAPLTPTDIQQRYNFPPGDGAGQSIAIAEFGGGYFADDLTAYCNKFGSERAQSSSDRGRCPGLYFAGDSALPPDQRKDELDASVEVMMDVQIVAGLCPKANIAVYFSSFDQGGGLIFSTRQSRQSRSRPRSLGGWRRTTRVGPRTPSMPSTSD